MAPRRERRVPDLARVLRVACRGRSDPTMTELPERTVRWAVETGLGPLLARAAAHHAPPASPLWRLVHGATVTARFFSVQQLGAMTEILDACAGELPPLVLLKGISLCEQYYPEAHLRPMRDIDFLLEVEAIPACEATLHALGYRQRSARPAAFYEGHHHGSPFVHTDTGQWVDVHRALVAPDGTLGSIGVLGRDHLATQLRWSTFRGRRVRRLSPELQIVHLACHWARGLRPLGGMVAMADMAFLLSHTPHVDWDRILAWVDASTAARALCLLLGYLDRHRIVEVPPDVVRRLHGLRRSPGPLTVRLAHALLDHYVVDGRDFGRLVSERTFTRVWKLLVFGHRPARRRALHPWVGLRDPMAVVRRLGGHPGASGGGFGGSAGAREPALALRREVNRMECNEVDAAPDYPRRRSGVRVRAVDDEVLILDRRRQLVHQVNPTARFIWERCDGAHTARHIASELARTFDVDVVTAERDVAAAVRQLEAVGLVEVRPRPAPARGQTRRTT